MATQERKTSRMGRGEAREKLLEAASALLSERDNLDISLSEIALRSGLNHGLVSYYFKGKEGLLIALLERDALTALTGLERLVGSNLAPEEKLQRHVRGIIQTYHRFPYINRLISKLQSDSAATAQTLASIFIAPLQALQQRIINEGVAVGRFRQVDPWFLYHSLIGMCEFIFQSRNTLPFLEGAQPITASNCDDYARYVFDLVMRGIREDEGSAG